MKEIFIAKLFKNSWSFCVPQNTQLLTVRVWSADNLIQVDERKLIRDQLIKTSLIPPHTFTWTFAIFPVENFVPYSQSTWQRRRQLIILHGSESSTTTKNNFNNCRIQDTSRRFSLIPTHNACYRGWMEMTKLYP